jgi:hypothetical protein
MGQYDNFNNAKRIRKAQRKLKRRTRCLFKSQSRIAQARAELDTAKLFSSCQIFKAFHGYAPNENVMFSDDNRVMWFISHVIPYDDIVACRIGENLISKSHTVTKPQGAISRAIVGHALAGDVGAVVGAMTASSTSETTYYQKKGYGFKFQIFTKDGSRHYCELPEFGAYRNNMHPKWIEVGNKIQSILDGKI